MQPRGPFAPPQPRPVVVFNTPRRVFAGIARRSRVTAERNVLGRRPMHMV